MSGIAYVNGAFLPLEDAKVSVLDRGFLFGDAIYEVSAVLDGRLVDNASHLARLERSLGAIDMALPMPLDAIEAVQRGLIARNDLVEGLVYLQVTRGASERDFVFPLNWVPTFIAFVQRKTFLSAPSARTGIAVKSVPDLRWARRDIKSVNMLAQVLAKQEARAAGCQEAFLVEDGFVTEAGSSTPFIITPDRCLVTRPNSHAILPGCTRKATMALAQAHDMRSEERPFTIAEALNASEVFITSATSFVTPVVRLDGVEIGTGKPGPLTTRLREIYIETARGMAE